MGEEETAGGTENKKYRVVDRRFGDESEEPAGDKEAAEGAPAESPVSASGAGGGEEGDAAGPEGGESPELRMQDAVRVALGMIRENVFFSLGLLISKSRRKPPDVEKALQMVEIFGGLADAFAERLGEDELARSPREPGLGETLDFVFRMMQGQVYMFLGLMPNPATGLVSADLEQARLGIDFCTALLERAKPAVSGDHAARLTDVVSEMKMNFVNQLKLNP